MSKWTTLEHQLHVGLEHCDNCHTYSKLISVFDSEVGAIVNHFLQVSTPNKLPSENISPDECNLEIVKLRQFFNSCKQCMDDIWFMLYRSVSSLLTRIKHRKRQRLDSAICHENTLINSFILFSNHTIPPISKHRLRWSFLLKEKQEFEITDKVVYANSEEIRRLRQNSVLAIFSENSHKHYFTQFWMHYLESINNVNLHIHVLNKLANTILPSLTNPLVVSDYLSSCFRCGGLISILALHGLCILMLEYQLEYPEYYKQLYTLITTHNFASRHRCELFRLIELSSKSSHVPAYVIACIIKRMLQVGIISPTPTLYFVLPFVRKLLHSHPNCLSLIHKKIDYIQFKEASDVAMTKEQEFQSPSLNTKANVNGEIANTCEEIYTSNTSELTTLLNKGIDVYNDNTNNLEEAHAEMSTLWELTALERHFLPIVPLMVGAYRSHVEDRTPLQCEKTYARLFTAELTRNSLNSSQHSSEPLSQLSMIASNEIPTIAYATPCQQKDRLVKL